MTKPECRHDMQGEIMVPCAICDECGESELDIAIDRINTLENGLELALDFIDKHPADPDISVEQTKAWSKLVEWRKENGRLK